MLSFELVNFLLGKLRSINNALLSVAIVLNQNDRVINRVVKVFKLHDTSLEGAIRVRLVYLLGVRHDHTFL